MSLSLLCPRPTVSGTGPSTQEPPRKHLLMRLVAEPELELRPPESSLPESFITMAGKKYHQRWVSGWQEKTLVMALDGGVT